MMMMMMQRRTDFRISELLCAIRSKVSRFFSVLKPRLWSPLTHAQSWLIGWSPITSNYTPHKMSSLILLFNQAEIISHAQVYIILLFILSCSDSFSSTFFLVFFCFCSFILEDTPVNQMKQISAVTWVKRNHVQDAAGHPSLQPNVPFCPLSHQTAQAICSSVVFQQKRTLSEFSDHFHNFCNQCNEQNSNSDLFLRQLLPARLRISSQRSVTALKLKK